LERVLNDVSEDMSDRYYNYGYYGKYYSNIISRRNLIAYGNCFHAKHQASGAASGH